MKKKLRIFELVVSTAAYGLAWYFYDWKLVLIIVLALWANNLKNKADNYHYSKQP